MRKIFILILLFSFTTVAHAQIITTFAGGGTSGLGDNGPATAAQLGPVGVVTDAAGNVFITDWSNNRVRKIAPSGIITTIAGVGAIGYNGDNGPATLAQLNGPDGIAIDATGNIYFSDRYNNRVRKIDAAGIITTIAGTGVAGYNGDNIAATAAQIDTPMGVAIDLSGNIFVADYKNNRIRKIDAAGIITTVAGTGTAGHFNGDNIAATAAQLYYPMGIAADGNGNIYITEFFNFRIRKVNASGIISTPGGNGFGLYSQDNVPATSATMIPINITLDHNNNIYFTDGRFTVRKIDQSGMMTIFAGNNLGFAGDGGPATAAWLFVPSGLAIDASGRVFVADGGNSRIRVIGSQTSATASVVQDLNWTVYPDPGTGTFTISIATATDEAAQVVVTNVTGQVVKRMTVKTNKPETFKLDEPNGTYFLSVNVACRSYSKQVVITR